MHCLLLALAFNLHVHVCPFFPISEWVEIIRRVRGMPEAKVKQLLVHEVNPKNAQGTIDLDAIDSVTSSDQEKR